ncbi:MAG: glutamate formimidoyltransferase [Candidatus Limnocylindria bacterium]
MGSLIECVPNFSEGRRPEVVRQIVDAIGNVSGVVLLDHTADPAHNRSVVTFAGTPDAVSAGAEEGMRTALGLIDLRTHSGVHPRIGAVDVVPFVPLDATPMREAVDVARALAERVAARFDLPVYLYGEAALRPDRRTLANVRRGQYEALRTAIGSDPARTPDFGPARLHPSGGAVAVGARKPLIAFNINLRTDDLRIARRIARAIRESSGGMPAVQAMGVLLNEADGRRTAQVSANLVDWERTGMGAVVREVRRLALEAGTEVDRYELIGLAPAAALREIEGEELGIGPDQALETRLARLAADPGPSR